MNLSMQANQRRSLLWLAATMYLWDVAQSRPIQGPHEVLTDYDMGIW